MPDTPPLPSDRQLVVATRSGNDDAWRELVLRHEAATRSVVARRSRRSGRVTADSVAGLRAAIETRPDPPEGVPAVRAVRPRLLAIAAGADYGPGDVPEPPLVADGTLRRDDLGDLAVAFSKLPEPWQTVLWHRLVEDGSAAEVSPLVGRSVGDVPELQTTAERGLFDAFVHERLARRPDPSAPGAVAELALLVGPWVRDALPPAQARRIDDVLADPAADGHDELCRLVAVAESLPELVAPAVAPALSGVSVTEHRAALGTAGRAFGAATLFANRSATGRRLALVGTAVVVVVALVGAAFLIRRPFSDDADPGSSTSVSSVPTTTPDSNGADTTAPPTTLDLRPGPAGTEHRVELLVEPGVRPVGFAGGPGELAITVSSPAPIYAGGTGTLDIEVANAGPTDAQASVEMLLPSGMSLDGVTDGATCDNPPDDSPFCNVAVAAGSTERVTVRLRLESRITGRLVVDGEQVAEPLDAPITATRHLDHSSVDRGDVIMIGNTVMSCADGTPGCDDVRAGRGEIVDRWDVDMEYVGAAPQFGVVGGSSATLDLPVGASVVAAHLYWSGDLKQGDVEIPDDGSSARVSLASPDGDVVQVLATDHRRGDVDATQYMASADVTDVVRAGGAGSYLVTNVVSAQARGSYAGWSLVVVTSDPAQPRRQLLVTSPFDWFSPDPKIDFAAELPIATVSGAAGRLDVLAFEGDRSFVPEYLVVGGVSVAPEGAFDSSIVGDRDPSFDNNLGIDIDTYDLVIDSPDGILPIVATSSFDGVRLAVLGLTVDLES